MKQRIVFAGAVPAFRLWVLVHHFAKANGLKMWTDNQQQIAMKLYVDAAALSN